MLAKPSRPEIRAPESPLTARAGEWLFEPKLDGLRCLAVRNGRETYLFYLATSCRSTTRFPAIVSAVRALPASNVVLDGELVGMIERRPDFGALQHGSAADIEYWVFDMPWLLGQDLRHLPIEERKGLLVKAVPDGGPIRVVPTLDGEADQLFTAACAQGWEGLVAKRAGSVYRGGRSSEWRKLKCECRQEMVIGGFTEPQGSRESFGALLLGYWEGDALVYAGKVGTGFTRATLRELYKTLSGRERPSSPFVAGEVERGARWVEPELVAEVAFSNWTRDGRLRHPSFVGPASRQGQPRRRTRRMRVSAVAPAEPGCGPPPVCALKYLFRGELRPFSTGTLSVTRGGVLITWAYPNGARALAVPCQIRRKSTLSNTNRKGAGDPAGGDRRRVPQKRDVPRKD